MSQRFKYIETPLAGLVRIERKSINDDRGFFSRFFCENEFKKMGLTMSIAQVNHSMTKHKGSVRGMHYQVPPYAEKKVVNCIQGKIFDVAVDLRKDSETFLQWHGEVLSAENKVGLYIPEGFAHGFQTLSEDCQLIYLHSNFYTPEAESGINALDSLLAIDWPLEITHSSERDKQLSMLDSKFTGIKSNEM